MARRSTRASKKFYSQVRTSYAKYLSRTRDPEPLTLKEFTAERVERRRLNINYNRYKKAYLKRKEVLNRSGYEMYDEMLSKTEYREIRLATINDRKREIAAGERKSIGNINAAIVSDQAYELSEKSAYAIFDFLETKRDELDIEYDTRNINKLIMKIREGSWLKEDVGLWDLIREYRADLFSQGMTAAEVRHTVSQTFFGSK